ncbi:hypothetical protein KIH39_11485 [Telmatocola sphagniphila]|uniref:Uncharacterized protein n=1 Tax=Telmatocola sphagniphila TaxID=1123043 RepID=A0A8E6B9R4_9BACT|nr:hypothetical protein [Telmatocola sphagniphila]QVL34497.1 hypothetical protein KIH39_11485 [Telmatocola sphagniphila]
MKKWILTLAAALLVVGASEAGGPFSAFKPQHKSYGDRPVLPVFQAAPWYLYWPYDAHFQTPAPIYGAFYAPPQMGGFNAQPYFPGSPTNQYPGTPMPYGPR